MKVNLYCCVIILCLSNVFLAHADITSLTAVVDKNPVMKDESLQLTVQAVGDIDQESIDLSTLSADFNIGRTSSSKQVQSINFKTTRSTTWTTTLFPKREGKFVIPSVSVDGEKTQPISVEVVATPKTQGAETRDIFVTTDVNKETVYLQQQLRYTIKLHLAQEIQRGSLQAPSLEGAVIKQLGEDKEYADIVNGRRYRIIERNFAIIPQKSGKFEIAGPLFEAEVLTNSRQSFGLFNRTKLVNRTGPSIVIDVKPVPNAFAHHWLPSEYVQLNQEWQSPVDTFRVGEPITRTLTLTAIGLVEEQLPEIDASYPPDLKTYPDQPRSATVEKDNALIAQRIESEAVIPTKEGSYIIPEVSVPWFNIVTQETEFATLPAQTINVLPALPSSATTALPPLVPLADNRVSDTVNIKRSLRFVSLDWLHYVLMALILIITLIAWRLPYRQKNEHIENQSSDTEQTAWQEMILHIKSNSGLAVHSVQSWLQIASKQSYFTAEMASHRFNEPEMMVHINGLMQSKYGNVSSTKSAISNAQFTKSTQSLIDILKKIRRSLQDHKNQEAVLKPLYPNN